MDRALIGKLPEALEQRKSCKYELWLAAPNNRDGNFPFHLWVRDVLVGNTGATFASFHNRSASEKHGILKSLLHAVVTMELAERVRHALLKQSINS